MLDVIGIKLNPASSNNLGYVRALVINNGNNWEQGNHETVPNNGEIFIYGDFDTGIQNKYEYGEVFQIEAKSADKGGACKYSSRGKSAKNVDRKINLSTLFETNKIITPDSDLYFESPIKPVGQIFFIANRKSENSEILGPFDVISSQWDKIQEIWQINVRPAPEISGLGQYYVYQAPFELVPSEDVVEIENLHSPTGKIYFGFNIVNVLEVISAPSELFIAHKELLTILDEALPQDLKLGRKGRREALSQLEASKKLDLLTKEPRIKDQVVDLLKQFEDREGFFQQLLDVGEVDANPPMLPGISEAFFDLHLQEEIDALNKQVDELTASNQNLTRENHDFYKQLSEAPKKEEQENIAEIAELEVKIETLNNELSSYKEHDNLKKEIDYLKRDKANLDEDSTNLKLLNDELQGNINGSNQQFIAKAASVLPFLGVLNKVSSGHENKSDAIEYKKDDFEDIEEQNLLSEILNRTEKLGYMAPPCFLECAVAMVFSSRYVGFYGDPGTGKTTLAKLLGHAMGGNESSACFISVGKGWTSSADFIGFRNPFADRFDFKNEYFKKFHSPYQPHENSDQPPSCIIFDEASLSSIDSYLSDFMSISNGLEGLKLENFSVGGEKFQIPSTARFFLTFNFDENTEALPRKIIDRIPLIHCENVESAERAIIDENKHFKPINHLLLAEFLRKQSDVRHENETRYRDVCEDVKAIWSSLPEVKNLGKRREIQIDNFIQIVSNFKDLDEGYLGEFFARSFLLPLINGSGDEYASRLELVGERSNRVKIKHEMDKIIENGKYFGSYKYL